MGKTFKRCRWCSTKVHRTSKIITYSDIEKFKSSLAQPLSVGDVLCINCFASATVGVREPLMDVTEKVTASNSSTSDDHMALHKKMRLDIPKASSGTTTCIVCGNKNTDKRPFHSKRLKPEARATVFANSRACIKHFDGQFYLQPQHQSGI